MEDSSPETAKAQRTRLLRLLLLALGGIGILFVLGRSCGRALEEGESRKPQTGSPSQPGQAEGAPGTLGFDDVTIGQEYKASVASHSHRVSTLEEETTALRRELGVLRAELSKSAAAQEGQLGRLDQVARLVQSAAAPRPEGLPGEAAQKPDREERGIRLIAFETPQGAKVPRHVLRIPAASAGDATVLNGVFGPTGGEPSPIRLRLDAAILGPTRSRIPLEGATLIGKAVGDANTTRVTVQLVSLSYVKSGGQSIEVPVHGYVVGEDGMEGIPGTYLYRLEDQVPLVVATEGAAGFANALAESQTTRSITPLGGATSVVTGDTLKFAGFKAAGGTSSKVGDILTERMRELRPAVWTPALKRVTVVFLEGVSLEGMEPKEMNDGEDHLFRDLDLHR
jgi:hypothetical protein